MSLTQIISGGQTGADRAGLDVALLNGFSHGGWCPKGRKAEDGPIEAKYDLTETPSANYLQRTEWNVRDSEGTIIFTMSETLSGGSLKTEHFAKKHNKPCLHINLSTIEPVKAIRHFIDLHSITILNIAGSRESKEPGVYECAIRMLDWALFE